MSHHTTSRLSTMELHHIQIGTEEALQHDSVIEIPGGVTYTT